MVDMFVLGFVIGVWIGVILKLIEVFNPFDLDTFQAAILAPIWVIGAIVLGVFILGDLGIGLAVAGVVYLIVSVIEVVLVVFTAGFAKSPGMNLLIDAVPAVFFIIVASIATFFMVQGMDAAIKDFWSFLPGVG